MARDRLVRLLFLVLLALGLFGCDHATKIAAKASLEGAAAIPIAPQVLHGAVELRYAANDDVAFSALQRLGVPHSPSALIGLSVLAIITILAAGIAVWRKTARASTDGAPASEPTPNADRASQAGFALIIGGALGNVVDRIARGYVVDFIHVRGWPIFNVADIAVVVGITLIVLSRTRSRPAPGAPVDRRPSS